MMFLQMLNYIGKYRIVYAAVLPDVQGSKMEPELVYFIYKIINFI
jgi:hypothetical protein